MKFIVEIEDNYIEEGEIMSELQNQVKSDVVNQIKKHINDRVEKQVIIEVKDTVEKQMYILITSAISDVIKNEEFPSRNSSSKKVTIEEYIKECLTYQGGWQNFQDVTKKIAENMSLELKKRYDLLFASQIVSKLSENGLLKDDAVKMLMENFNK